MPEKTIAVELPEPALRKLKRAGELTYRSVDEILVSTIPTTSICRRTSSTIVFPSLISASLAPLPLLIEEIE